MLNRVLWAPQPGPQTALVECPFPEIFYGGARGGGKTDGVLGKWLIKERRYGRHFNAMMFRKSTTASQDAIERSRELYRPAGGRFNEGKLIWRMPNGGRVGFGYLDSVSDADQWQGRNLTDAWVEEAGHYADPAPIDRLFGVLRSAQGVPVQLILTGNPGGAGQHWIAERYRMIPFPAHPLALGRELANGSVHRYAVIPSRIEDNRILLESDPGYIDRLHLVGGKALVRAWLEGDWSAIEGAFFDEWQASLHVLEPFRIPRDWLRAGSFDWGSARPFSYGLWTVVPDDMEIQGRTIPKGAVIRYREWYGCQKDKPNTGLKLTAEQVADGILEREAGEQIAYRVADPAIFAEDGGPSLAQRMTARKVVFRPADNTRVGRLGAMGGWDMMRARLRGRDGIPMLYVFDTCKDFIRTVPVLQHDETRPEDLDTESEDHAADECRYFCMSRPWIPAQGGRRPAGDSYRPMTTEETDSWRT